ncbi:MAG: hypothetical protein Kow0010_27580 [Dehalococcoidia bacterium]
MKTMTSMLLSFTAAAYAATPAALAQHGGDVGLALDNNRIATGVYEMGVFVPGQRVFGAEFGELVPNFTDEPGFDSLPGTFPVPSTITFNVLGALRLWEGDHFGNLIPAEQISIGFGPITPVLTPLTDVFTPGFSLPVGSNGQWHRHLEFTLGAPASDGIYLLQMNLVGNQPSMQASLPFWFVFNQNMPESEHDEAIRWVNDNLVPAPGAAGVLLVAGGFMGTRRRRNSTHA